MFCHCLGTPPVCSLENSIKLVCIRNGLYLHSIESGLCFDLDQYVNFLIKKSGNITFCSDPSRRRFRRKCLNNNKINNVKRILFKII